MNLIQRRSVFASWLPLAVACGLTLGGCDKADQAAPGASQASAGTGAKEPSTGSGSEDDSTTLPESEDRAPEEVVPDPLPAGGFPEIRGDAQRDPNPVATPEDLAIVRRASDNLGYELLRKLSAGNDNNVVIAPATLYASLGQVLAAARGETEKELLNLMGPGLSSDQVHRAISRLEMKAASNQRKAQKDKGPLDLRYINRLFVPGGTKPEPAYLEMLGRRYGTGVFGLDGSQGDDANREKINGWVHEQTQTRIKELLPMGSLSRADAPTLVSALRFRAPWQKCLFCSGEEESAPFFLNDGTKIDSSISEASTWDTRMGFDGDFIWKSFSLGDGGLALYIFLPYGVRREETLARLSSENFRQWMSEGERCSLTLKLPMLALRSGSVDLQPYLKELGVRRLFGEGGAAQLGGFGLDTKNGLKGLMHQVSFELSRHGLEGGQGPTVDNRRDADSMPPHCSDASVTQTFYFVVYDKRAELVQLVGRVSNPLKD